MTTKVPSARHRDDFGPFVTAVFTVSNGDVSTSVNYGNDVTNNNNITSVNENGFDKTKPQKSSIKKPTTVYKGHVSEDANGRKTVSFTEDTLDNESASKVFRKESRRKQRIVHHEVAPPVRHNGPIEKEDIECNMRIDDYDSPTLTEEPTRSEIPAQLPNGHPAFLPPLDGRNYVTNNTYKLNGHLPLENGNIHSVSFIFPFSMTFCFHTIFSYTVYNPYSS